MYTAAAVDRSAEVAAAATLRAGQVLSGVRRAELRRLTDGEVLAAAGDIRNLTLLAACDDGPGLVERQRVVARLRG